MTQTTDPLDAIAQLASKNEYRDDDLRKAACHKWLVVRAWRNDASLPLEPAADWLEAEVKALDQLLREGTPLTNDELESWRILEILNVIRKEQGMSRTVER